MTRSVRLWTAAAGMAAACAIGIAIGAHLPGGPNDPQFAAKVRASILSHPDIVREAAEKLRIDPMRQAIETPFRSAWAGNPKGDVTLVVFTDYNCPYCRATSPEIHRLLASDPKLKVVWREMPVLGPDSTAAAAAALAAAIQGKYYPFHRALFSGGHPDQDGIAAAAKTAGVAPDSLMTESKGPEVQTEIQTNLEIARALAIDATPFFVIGNRTYQGAIGYDRLRQAVADARADAD